MSPRPNNRGTRSSQGRDRVTRSRVSSARLAAYDVLRDVTDRDAYANLALASRIREARLDPRDSALVTELASGALRMRGRYDAIIEIASRRSVGAIDSRTLNVLRLGTHQLLGMRTAGHAAVNESVELQRRVGNEKASGFVNGVLREISRASNAEWDQRIDAAAASPDEALAVRTSHPSWIIRALRDALRSEGREDELEALLAADNSSPQVSLALLPGSGLEVAHVAQLGAEAGTGTLTATGPSPIGLELAGGNPATIIASLALPQGMLRVQDQGSQLAALALTRATEVRPGERWLDLCAGPGGKTAVLAAEAVGHGATLRANEVSDHRAQLVRDAVQGVPADVEVVNHDGREEDAYGGAAALFDRILIDAPCSGLGALRRRPEARWRKLPGDLPQLTTLQGELIDSALRHLAPGGVLAYVTCSPHIAETQMVIAEAKNRHHKLVELDARLTLQRIAREELDLADRHTSVQLWPHRHGTDAMFVALLTY